MNAKNQQLGFPAKTPGDRLSREFEQIAVFLSQGVVRRSRHQLLCTAVAQAERPIAATDAGA